MHLIVASVKVGVSHRNESYLLTIAEDNERNKKNGKETVEQDPTLKIKPKLIRKSCSPIPLETSRGNMLRSGAIGPTATNGVVSCQDK